MTVDVYGADQYKQETDSMKHHCLAFVAAGLLAAVSGCGSESQKARAASAGTDAATTAKNYQELMAHDWTIDPGVESYSCGYKTLTDDLYISDFRPLMASGTHHVLLGYQDPGPPDGTVAAGDPSTPLSPTACTGVTFGDVLTFVATVGTQELGMPEGVAVRIPAGKQLVLGLHILNSGTEPISGRSGIQVVSPDRSKVVHEAEVISAQTVVLNIPPGKVTQTATCTMVADATIFAVLPHMHKTGVHMTTTAGGPEGGLVTLLDADYQFVDQRYKTLDPPVQLQKGDQMHVQCDYDNPGPNTLTVGESTTKNEMCVTFTYRYPAVSMNADTDLSLGFPMPRGWCIK